MLKKIKWSKDELLKAVEGAISYYSVAKRLGFKSQDCKNVQKSIKKHLIHYEIAVGFDSEDSDKFLERVRSYHQTSSKRFSDFFRKTNDAEKLAHAILRDCRSSDRKRGLTTDLTLEDIVQKIKDGCCYCGNKELRMTLDRIANNGGHTKENTLGACIRCNYMRRDIPYKAWLHLLPKIREAVQLGLFEDWTGRTNNCKV